MALMEWSDRFKTGMPEIDSQHRQLFKCINDLHEAMKGGQGNEVVGHTLRFLRNYTARHFRDEESAMAKMGYPGLLAHKKLHEGFVRRVSSWTTDTGPGRTSMTIDVSSSLSEWLRGHILVEDMKYAAHVPQKRKAA